jgi:hypothetical protein
MNKMPFFTSYAPFTVFYILISRLYPVTGALLVNYPLATYYLLLTTCYLLLLKETRILEPLSSSRGSFRPVLSSYVLLPVQ